MSAISGPKKRCCELTSRNASRNQENWALRTKRRGPTTRRDRPRIHLTTRGVFKLLRHSSRTPRDVRSAAPRSPPPLLLRIIKLEGLSPAGVKTAQGPDHSLPRGDTPTRRLWSRGQLHALSSSSRWSGANGTPASSSNQVSRHGPLTNQPIVGLRTSHVTLVCEEFKSVNERLGNEPRLGSFRVRTYASPPFPLVHLGAASSSGQEARRSFTVVVFWNLVYGAPLAAETRRFRGWASRSSLASS